MANYKSSQVSGEKYRRANRVKITNTLDAVPTIQFSEEDVIVTADGHISSRSGGVSDNLSDPSKTFSIVNPETGEDTGATMSYLEVYVALHSMYLALAKARDIEAEAPVEE